MEGDRARNDNLLLQSSNTQLSKTLLKGECSQMAVNSLLHGTVGTHVGTETKKRNNQSKP